MKAVLVGEAWGPRENNYKHALVGPSGRELTIEMGRAGFAPFMKLRCRKCHELVDFIGSFHCHICNEYLAITELDLIRHWKVMKTIDHIHVTNVFNEQPPGNDLGFFFGTERETDILPPWKASKKTPGTHLKLEHEHHIHRLYSEINSIRPNLIIAMGNAAVWALLDCSPKISDMRGYIDWSERLGIKVLPTYHTAHVLRNNAFRPTCIADYKKAKIEAEFPEIRRPDRWLNIIDPTPEGIAEGYKWFQKPATSYANDIETYRDQITIVGFSRSPDDALVIVLRDFETDKTGKYITNVGTAARWNGFEGGNINYWPTADLEFDAWKLIQFGLQTRQEKIYQNGCYDVGYFLRMGLQPKNVRHDTMLWFHSWMPEQPKSLGYLGSLFTSDIAWKRMRHRDSLKRDE